MKFFLEEGGTTSCSQCKTQPIEAERAKLGTGQLPLLSPSPLEGNDRDGERTRTHCQQLISKAGAFWVLKWPPK